MPLHIDLHHEIAQQELARRRDPLRMAMLACLVIAIGFVANYFWVMERSHSVNVRYETLSDEWARVQPKAKAAKAREADLDAQIKATDTLIKDINGRFYWAPVLDEILRTVPRDVQLVRVTADTPVGTTVNVLTIAGLSSGTEPRKEAEAVRTALDARLEATCKHVNSSFKTLDDGDQFVMLEGRRLPTAVFTMEFQMQVAEAEVAPVAPPIRKSRAAAAAATE